MSAMMKHSVLFASLLVLSACGSTKLTPVGEAQPPRSPDCDFDIFTSTPQLAYTEIGTIDVNFGAYGHNTFRDLADFKEEIRPQVCESGGDGAIALANGLGFWIKATVIQFTDDATPIRVIRVVPSTSQTQVEPAEPTQPKQAAPPIETPSVESSGVEPSGAEHSGCSYDTQCKGDRICEAGRCVSPSVP